MKPPRLRIVSFNDCYKLENLPRIQSFLVKLTPAPQVVCLTGDFLSPSTLSSMDGGKGMVATLKALGLTHVSLGNHEADLRLPRLIKRLRQFNDDNHSGTVVLNTNIIGLGNNEGMPQVTQPFDVVTTPCGQVNVGLLGLLSDEPGLFPNGTFRGAPISNVLDAFEHAHQDMVPTVADWLLPLTHQSVARDEELAQRMLTIQPGSSLILGGHEHVPFDECIEADNEDASKNNESSFVRILKAGMDGEAVSLVDLTFDVTENEIDGSKLVRLGELETELVEMKHYEPSVVVQNIVNSHMALLRAMEDQDILHAQDFLPPGKALSSSGTRFRQTTLGGILCLCIKEELDADVAILNGATIKGNTTYHSPNLTYAQLKQELPFPTKYIVVKMKRWELQDAIQYSREGPVPGDENNFDNNDGEQRIVERKGYLQVDYEFDRSGFDAGMLDDVLSVALPRNLLTGFCKIKPLMRVGERLKNEGTFPGPDDYIPAIDLVIRHASKEMWYDIVRDHYSFDDLDPDCKGFLTREDVKRMLRRVARRNQKSNDEPPDFLVDDMMAAIDENGDGSIDPGEFSFLLAAMEREHNAIRFD